MRWVRRFLFLAMLGVLGLGVNQALIHPDTPLPPKWNPLEPFDVADPPSPLTDWKIAGLMAQAGACEAALSRHADMRALNALDASETCGIADRVRLARVGDARLRPFETTCEIGLRLALWERHGLQPAAERLLGQRIREIRHYASYSCRRIRTSRGEGARWSTHATARAVDVSGVILEDGSSVDLRADWEGEDAEAAFLREAQRTACDTFGLVLGPEYNALHADHFHIQLDREGCL